MLSLTDRAAMASALDDPDLDLDLRVLITLRARLLDEDTELFVENGPGTELGIHYLCQSHFWFDGKGSSR